jgi:hypothetical protein
MTTLVPAQPVDPRPDAVQLVDAARLDPASATSRGPAPRVAYCAWPLRHEPADEPADEIGVGGERVERAARVHAAGYRSHATRAARTARLQGNFEVIRLFNPPDQAVCLAGWALGSQLEGPPDTLRRSRCRCSPGALELEPSAVNVTWGPDRYSAPPSWKYQGRQGRDPVAGDAAVPGTGAAGATGAATGDTSVGKRI